MLQSEASMMAARKKQVKLQQRVVFGIKFMLLDGRFELENAKASFDHIP